MGKKASSGKASSLTTAESAARQAPAVRERDPGDILTHAEKDLDEDEVVGLFAGLSSARSKASLSAPLVAAVDRMQMRMQNMSKAISNANGACLRKIRQAAFGGTGSGDPLTTSQTPLASACNLISEGQAAFVDCQSEMMGAVSDSVERTAHHNFVVLKISAMRTNDLQAENAELKHLSW